jgi:N-acyl-L-homoserine lactone synthetase
MGTMRFVPMTHELTLTEKLQQGLDIDPSLMADSWEVGRLVIDPAFRQGPELLKQCLLLALCFVCDNSNVKNFHASCTYVLSRLYRRFGFSVIAKDVPLAEADKTYTLIHGTVPEVSRALMGDDAARPPLV